MDDSVTTSKGLRCSSCGHYINPQRKLLYPNTDNDAVGWVTCARSSTVKRDTMACGNHTIIEQRKREAAASKPKRQLLHKPPPAGRRLIK